MSGLIATYDIQTTLDAQLKAVAGLPQFFEENSAPLAQNINPFSRSTLAPAKSTIQSLGSSKVIFQTGLYQVDLFYPTAYGFSTARQQADLVINAFQPGALALPDGINNLTILTAWSLPGDAGVKGAFWMLPVRVEWQVYAHI